jgi:hypothetical protein
MYTETQKLHVIEGVLKTDDPATLMELEAILNRPAKHSKTLSAQDFAGKWSAEDAALIEKAIEDGCEQMSEDDWK